MKGLPSPCGRWEDTAFLERVHVPRPFRAMKRLVGGALRGAAASAPTGGRTVLFFAEEDGLADAATAAGFTLRATWRVWAIEVKSGRLRKPAGLAEFCRRHPAARPVIIGPSGMPLVEFLESEPAELFR